MIFAISAAAIVGPLILVFLIWKIWRPKWFGFSGKTLWDWIALLAVPTVVGFATFLISAITAQIERERGLETALQRYFERVSELALDERLESRPEIASAIGRAETMAVLRLVEGERAGRALAFLAEMDLLKTFSVEFESLDLQGVEMKGIDMSGLDFEGSQLRGVDFEGAELSGVDFEDASLEGADLKKSDLSGSQFDFAEMGGAELHNADLRGANLQNAIGLKAAQISVSCMDETTILPIGFAKIIEETLPCSVEIED